MPRKAAAIEHLERLVEWAGGEKAFCNATGIKRPNLNAYLNGSKRITWDWLRKKTTILFGTPPAFISVCEGMPIRNRALKASDIDDCSGVYALLDSAMKVIYFGKATNLRAEINQALSRKITEIRPWGGGNGLVFSDVARYVSAYMITRSDKDFEHDVEALVLRLFVNNVYNKNRGKFKRTK